MRSKISKTESSHKTGTREEHFPMFDVKVTFWFRVAGKEQARGPIKASYGLPEEQWQVESEYIEFNMKEILFCRSVTSTGPHRRSRGKAILTQKNSRLGGEGAPQEVQG